MRGLLALFLAAVSAGAAQGQMPRTASPRLARVWARADTAILVWVIGEPSTDLGSLAALVTRAGGQVRHLSEFVHAVSARVPGSALPALAAARGIRRIQLVGSYVRSPERSLARRAGPTVSALPPPAPVLPGRLVRPPAPPTATAAAQPPTSVPCRPSWQRR